MEENQIEHLTSLVEEMVHDNTSLFDVLNRIRTEQDAIRTALLQELGQVRTEFAGATSLRMLRELCRELGPSLTALQGLLDNDDFSDSEVIRGHIRSLTIALHAVLERMGAQKIPVDPGVELFDPTLHVCVKLVKPEVSPFPTAPARTVIRVLEDGYMAGDKVITPVKLEVQASA